MIPGEYVFTGSDLIVNEGKLTVEVEVRNDGDRPVQVGSHFHFYESNAALIFDRELTLGYHLDIVAGGSVRFEPSVEKTVRLVPYGGERKVFGFRNLVDGQVALAENKGPK